jgi:hypothetical protein
LEAIMLTRIPLYIMPALFAVYIPMCAPAVHPTMNPWDARMAELWQNPEDLAERDLFYGPWGNERAPDPNAVYTWVANKDHGTNPGVVVLDPKGHEWHVKQPPDNHQGAEGPIEVVLSRVLSAVGYHQPPVYFLSSFTMRDASGTRVVPGGRFRLKVKSLQKDGDWAWQQNPFVGTKPYQGLLAILTMFDSSDLKNVNNSMYRYTNSAGDEERWYVVRDLGTALGETGRLHPRRGDINLFENHPFITGITNGYVDFSYHGWHQELLRHRLTPEDVEWASDLLQRISYDQWTDAFRAGGYDEEMSRRFIASLNRRIAEGYRVASKDRRVNRWIAPALLPHF